MWVCCRTYYPPKSKKKRKRCDFSVSDFKGTFLDNVHIHTWKVLCFINKWCDKRFTHGNAVRDLSISPTTSVDWRSFCSEVCENWLHHQQPIGGPGQSVEIDETLITTRKYNVGRLPKQVWLFGGIERESKKRFVVPLLDPEGEHRDRATLLPLIKRFIRAGSVIISDSWGAYKTLGQEGYTHRIINHSENFVDPKDKSIHTQCVERLWRDIKEWVKRPGMRHQYLRQYLARYLFLTQCKGCEIHSFLVAAARLYPPGSHTINRGNNPAPAVPYPDSEEEGERDFDDPQPGPSH